MNLVVYSIHIHGSKRGIEGPLSLSESRSDNDFGQGFYCGESFSQSAMFVARYPNSVCYFAALDERGLNKRTFLVDNDWMLAVALFRGKLANQSHNDALMRIGGSVACADIIVAPIADNRMFEIIDSFSDGEITDEQCKHNLSATGLGLQYVLRTDAALQGIVSFQPHYLCEAEKATYLQDYGRRVGVRADKVKAAKRKYRAMGRYIEELLP